MKKWIRPNFTPCLPLGDHQSRITESQKHRALSRTAAGEGIVLLKNNHKLLPLPKGAKVAMFGKSQIDYVKGGGGSGDVTVSYAVSYTHLSTGRINSSFLPRSSSTPSIIVIK